MPLLLSSFRRQQLLVDFAAIKSKCPEGIYLTPEAGNPSTWCGVYFVREGPYSSAVLRFELVFPMKYPETGPLLNFSTEIFHPLLVPLTTYTFTSGATDPNTTLSTSETERLAPGFFNLRYAFPTWYSAQEVVKNEMTTDIDCRLEATLPEDLDATNGDEDEQKPDIQSILQYVKTAFEDAKFLDTLPLRAAMNTNAWHAWRAHRNLPKLVSRPESPAILDSSVTPLSPVRNPRDWKWDGVWESRVKNGTEESMSEALLYGNKGRGGNTSAGSIRFARYDDEQVQEMQASMLHAFGLSST